MSDDRYQAVVVGAGLVGAATALALGRKGLRVALVERTPPVPPDANWDARIYAISPASQRFLHAIGAWQALDPARVQPVYRMDVAGDTRGALRLDAYASGTSHLAHILESGRLQHALWHTLAASGSVDVIAPATIQTLERDGDDTRLMFADGRTLTTQLVIGADGAHSRIRDWAGLTASTTPYDQQGVVANFECERAHRGTAFQWFFAGEVLAWLPLPGTRLSMVWSMASSRAAELLALDAEALSQTVQTAGHDVLGRLRVLAAPKAFPLQLLRAHSTVAAGVVLVGDAAHGVHPLAGQGVNLGLGDAEALSQTVQTAGHDALGRLRVLAAPKAFPLQLLRAHSTVAAGVALVGDAAHGVHPLAGQGVNLGLGDAEALADALGAQRRISCGDLRVLQRYARSRAEPVARMQGLTHGLHHLFAASHASWLRNAGLSVVDHLPPVKSALVRAAMS